MPLPKGDIDIVAEGDKDPIRLPKARHPEDVAPDLHPPLPALGALRDIYGPSSGSRGLTEGGYLFQSHPQDLSERGWFFLLLRRPKSLLIDQGQVSDIVFGLYILWVDVLVPVSIKRSVLFGIHEVVAKVFQLNLFELFSRQGLKPWIPIFHVALIFIPNLQIASHNLSSFDRPT